MVITRYERIIILEKKTVIYLLIFIVVFAFLIRVANAPYMVLPQEGEIVFTDNDSPYHVLRIIDFAKGVTNQIQFHDHRSYHPEGYVCHWSPGFDFILGLLGRVGYYIWPNDFALKVFISLLIPVLGTITLIFYYLLSRSFMNRPSSLIASLLFGLLPFHITGSYFSIVDHHVAEYLFITLLYLAFTKLKNRFGPFLFALIVTAGYWIIPGFLLDYVVFTAAAVFALILGWFWEGHEVFSRKLFLSQVLAFVILFPTLFFSYYGSQFSLKFDSLSLFQGVTAFIGSLVTSIFYYFHQFNKKKLGLLLSIFLSIATITLITIFWPEFFKQLQNGVSFMKGHSYIRLSSEITPLRWDRFTAGYLKAFWPLLLIGMGVVSIEALRKRDFFLSAFILPLIFYGFLSFFEVKFFRYYLIFSVMAGVFCCYKFYEITSEKKNLRYSLVFLFIFLIVYGFSDYKKVFLLFKSAQNDPAFNTLSYISKNYSQGKDGTTIFAWWDLGHKIIYYTNFYNVDNPFLIPDKISHSKDVALFNFSRDENSALSILEKYDSNIVIMESALLQLPLILPLINGQSSKYIFKYGAFTPYFVGTLNGRLYFFDGTYLKDNSGKGQDIPAVSSFRLVYETQKMIKTGKRWQPFYKVYEKVPGAAIKGALEEYATHVVDKHPTLFKTLMTNTGRKFLYVAKAIIDSEGKSFVINTPYAAPGKNGMVRALTSYTLNYGNQRVKVIVTEEDVKKGRTILLKY